MKDLPTPAGLLHSLTGAVSTGTAELSALIAIDPELYGLALKRIDTTVKTVGSAVRLACVSIGGSIFFFTFIFFFIILPIAFFFEVVLKGELQLGEIKDTVMVPIVDSLPSLPAFPPLPALPFSSSSPPPTQDIEDGTSTPDCETSQCESVRDFSTSLAHSHMAADCLQRTPKRSNLILISKRRELSACAILYVEIVKTNN